MHIKRNLKNNIEKYLTHFPVVVILGARQVGKTTLAKRIIDSLNKESLYLDLELHSDINKLSDPELFLNHNKDKCIIIDEVQRMPEFFPLLRSIIDQERVPGRFILLGSANTHVLKLSSESLAGRVSYVELTGFLLNEVAEISKAENLWLKGGFPEPFMIDDDEIRQIWYNSFLKTVTERDLPQLGLKVSSQTVLRFIRMLGANQGGLLNKSSLSKSLGISHANINEILNYLNAIFLIRILEPYYVNIGKRLTKSPKVYIRDSGLTHFLCGVDSLNSLLGNQISGNSWEGFCVEQIIGSLGDKYSYNFFRTQDQAESDIVISKGDKPISCIEIKLSSKPSRSKGFTSVINDLKTQKNYMLIPECNEEYPLSENVTVTDLQKIITKFK